MASKKYITFGAPKIATEEIREVVKCLKSGWIGTGPRVASFEEEFRSYIGCEHAVALNSCTAALHLSMLVAGLGPGDEVITTAMTFCATVNAIIHAGATPVLVDCLRDSMLIDPELVRKAVTKRSRALVPVHLSGRPCDMDTLGQIARDYKLIVIDDAAHAIEAWYKGRKIGNAADLTCFSFYVTKNVVTGEGGMVTTAREDYANQLRVMALHGMSRDAWKRFSDAGYKHYDVIYSGFKYNMMDIQAALGIHQLRRVGKNLERRRAIWQRYDEAFAALPVGLPLKEEPNTVHARHLYTLIIDERQCGISRDQFMQALHQEGIGTGVHYRGIHMHSYYRQKFGWSPESFPNATWIGERTVSLPLSPALTDAEVERIIEAVWRVLKA
jgi:dTDP-4-amino-4,6-dideoxygalactose transaminase